tara:strand:+ start:1132 stop:2181 length:1050 start_codon:yes stop_codon:yes gene_type:complete
VSDTTMPGMAHIEEQLKKMIEEKLAESQSGQGVSPETVNVEQASANEYSIETKEVAKEEEVTPYSEGYFEKEIKIHSIPEDSVGPMFRFNDENTFHFMLRNIARKEWMLVMGPTGCGKSYLAEVLAKTVGHNLIKINFGDTSNPSAKLMGYTAYTPEKGTHFVKSEFIRALESEEPTMVLLDEVTRDRTQELQNILVPLLDGQKQLVLDETDPPETIKISDNVYFYATANIGRQYIGATSTIDRAWKDRFTGGMYKLNYLDHDMEVGLLLSRFDISKEDASKICKFANKLRSLYEADEISTPVSTRMTLAAASMVYDGVELPLALTHVTSPFFDNEDDKVKIHQVIQSS